MQITCPPLELTPSRPAHCPYCNCTNLKIKQTIRRKVKDQRENEVIIWKMYCHGCQQYPRIYPEGMPAFKHRTRRLIFLGTLLYITGLSYQKIQDLLQVFLCNPGFSISDTTFWRDIQAMGEIVRKSWFKVGHFKPELYVGLDGTYIKIKGEVICLTMVIDLKDGWTIRVQPVDEHQTNEVRKMFEDLLKRCQIKGVVTDGLETIREAIEEVPAYIEHQICLAHAKKNHQVKVRQLRKAHLIDDLIFQQLVEVIKNPSLNHQSWLLAQLRDPPDPYPQELRRLLQDLYRKLPMYTAYQRNGNLPETNNRTEQAIGRSKVRYKTIRGFKSLSGALNFFAVTQTYGQRQFSQIYNLTNQI